MQQRRDDLKRIADAVIDLAQEHLALGGQCREPVARGVNLGLGLVTRLADRRLPDRAVDRRMHQRNKLALRVLDEIVGGTSLQRSNRDLTVLRGGDEHDGRRTRHVHNPLQRLQPIEAGHVLVERDHIDPTLRQPCKAGFAIAGMLHGKPQSRQPALHEPRQTGIVFNIEQRGQGGCHELTCGTWMTEKNRPSWRIALAKLS